MESIYDNGSKIVGLTPVTKSAEIAFNHGLYSTFGKAFGGTQILTATLKSPGGKALSYGLAALAWINTINSAFTDDPAARANARGVCSQMKEIMKIIVQVIHVLSFCGVILSGVLGAVYEMIGHVKFEQALSAIGISKGFERIWVISAILLLLLITTYFIKTKLFS